MKVGIDLPSVAGHEAECEAIRSLLHGRLCDDVLEDADGFQNLSNLRQQLAYLGCALFKEKRLEEAETVFRLCLDHKLHTQPTFDRLIKIYSERKDAEQLEGLLGRGELKMFTFRGDNYLADRIQKELARLRGKQDEPPPRAKELNIDHWKERLWTVWGVTNEDWEKFKKKSGSPRDRDAVWGMYNMLRQRSGSIEREIGLCEDMAHFVNEEGRNPFELWKEARYYQTLGFVKAKVDIRKPLRIDVPEDACPVCRSEGKKKVELYEAYDKHVLPHKDCTCHFQGGKYPFCRCRYVLP